MKRFNMVEIVISLVIIMVALIGVMSLIPHQVESAADAVNRMCAADAADQFLEIMKGRIGGDWTQADPLPETKYSGEDTDMIWGVPFWKDDSMTIRPEAENEFAGWDPEKLHTGVFLAEQRTGPASDFRGILRVWRETYDVGGTDGSEKKDKKDKKIKEPKDWKRDGKMIIAHYPPGQGGKRCITLLINESGWENGHKDHPYDHIGPCDEDIGPEGELAARASVYIINVEVSWPPEAPWEKRSKVVYQAEIAKAPTTFNW